MKKKFILIAVLMMYLAFTFTSPMVFAEDQTQATASLGIFTPDISFDVDNSTIKGPIATSQTTKVTITVKFKLNMGNLSKRLFFNRRIGRLILFGPSYIIKLKQLPKASINLTIDSLPIWCNASLDKTSLDFDYDNQYKTAQSTLTFSINESAPALEQGDIKISAAYAGNNWTIPAVTNQTDISIQPAYEPVTDVVAETQLSIPPLTNTTVPINITNNGNGDSMVSIQFTKPEFWNASLDQDKITVKISDSQQIILTVNPPKNFTNVTFNLTITPTSTAGEFSGSPITLPITFTNSAHPKEETGLDIAIIAIIVILVVVILLIVTILLLRSKK